MADGTIIIDTKIDQSGADIGVQKLQNKVESTTNAVKKQSAAVSDLESKYKEWQAIAAAQQKNFGVVTEPTQAGLSEASAKLDTARIKLDQLKIKAQEAGEALQAAMSPKVPIAFSNATKAAHKRIEKLKSMLDRYIMRALFLVAVYQGIQKVKEYFGEAMKTNADYVKAVGQLKAAFMTLAQPILQVLLPAVTKLAQVLTYIVTQIAAFFSVLSGSSLKASQDSAKSLYDQQEALSKVGKSAKNAKTALASFDEINKLTPNTSGTSDTTIAADWTALDDTDGKLQNIATLVEAIGAGILLWKISSAFTTGIKNTAELFAGLALIIFGCYEAYLGFSDALTNGVDWNNLQQLILGVVTVALGLYVAFGSMAAGIGLVVGGLLLLYTGFTDIINNGANLQNTLLIIAGIIATGLGIALLTGSLIPALVAAFAAIVAAVLSATGNLGEFMQNIKDNILGGLIDFITGVFTGDWEKAWMGIQSIFKGILNAIVITLESAINFIISGINWLIAQINTISYDVPSWVPVIGGQSWGFDISSIKSVQLPRLATGAVIPPNSEFLAVLGDQKSGTNVEAPLDTIVQAFRQAMSESGGGRSITVIMEMNKREFARAVYNANNDEAQRVGVSLA